MSNLPNDQAIEQYFSALLNDAADVSKESGPVMGSTNYAEIEQRPLQKLLDDVGKTEHPKLAEPQEIPEALSEQQVAMDVDEQLQELMAMPAVLPAELTFALEELVVEQEQAIEAVPDVLEETPLPEGAVSSELGAVPTGPETKWQNIELEEQFQALFFELAGITFAVPLTQLGGIHKIERINTLFGKPPWFAGVMTQREVQINVVDTAKWVMPGKELEETDYTYLILLGNTNWGLACEKLQGTEWITQEQIKWRHREGKRPWLAGMVKEKMCALLHVDELVNLLTQGLDIEGV